jgi:hypothetical protein
MYEYISSLAIMDKRHVAAVVAAGILSKQRRRENRKVWVKNWI